MKRVLSGLQPSGQLHIGNYAGAIQQFLRMQRDHEMYIFVAAYHALTSAKNGDELRAATRQVAIDYLAFGLDPSHCHLYRQQDVPEVTELAWLLSCVCPTSLMEKGVAYKDKVANGLAANIGLYTYPILQAADILSVDPDLVPVGRDQVQNIEICRDLAAKFNRHVDGEIFRLPEYRVREDAAIVPGVDGKKMSKSYGNTLDPFMDEKPLRKRIMGITTDSKGVDDVKVPEDCTIYQIYAALAGTQDHRTQTLADRYRTPGMGYGHAKQELFELIMDLFGPARTRRAELMAHPTLVDDVLTAGAKAAREKAQQVTAKARAACGL